MAEMDAQEWQGRVGKSWAHEWQRTDRSFSHLTAELEWRILELEFTRALDVGCGAGELSLKVARQRPTADMIGVDISPDLIEAARGRAGDAPNLRFELADAATWQPGADAKPDLLMSRHGVMFFPAPVAAFANLHAATASGAQMVFSCFREVSHNPFFGDAGRLIPAGPGSPDPDPYAPGPFAFAESARVERILSDAGWRDIRFEPFDFAMIAGAGNDPVADAVSYFSRIGPAARALAGMDDTARTEVQVKLAELAKHNLKDGIVSLGAGVWIVSASHN